MVRTTVEGCEVDDGDFGGLGEADEELAAVVGGRSAVAEAGKRDHGLSLRVAVSMTARRGWSSRR